MAEFERMIFRALYTGKWLSIEYRNRQNEIKNYWIAIKDIDTKNKKLIVDGLRLSDMEQGELAIFSDSILKAEIIEGSLCKINQSLINDITIYPNKYDFIFNQSINLKILEYLADCNRFDNTPYKSNYTLIDGLDESVLFNSNSYLLSHSQFETLVKKFQYKTEKSNSEIKINQLCMNVLSVHTSNGLYVLAYRKLMLDVKMRTLKAGDEIIINKEFSISGDKYSIRQFLDETDYELLDNFSSNAERIKDIIMAQSRKPIVDDMPHFIALGFDIIIDLKKEYTEILRMYESNSVPDPISAFFGELKDRPRRSKDYSVILLDNKINLDQLLAIHNAIKYPITYIQGPPGTGKTNTIINMILTAFYHEKTVLACSYNNNPVKGIFDKLKGLKFNNKRLPLPILRLGSLELVKEAINYIKELYEYTKTIPVYERTLVKNKDEQEEKNKKLTLLLKKYEEKLDLEERKETLIKVLEKNATNMAFVADLQTKQLLEIRKRIEQIGEITDDDALALLDLDSEDILKYLHFISAKHIQRLNEPKYKEFLDILYLKDEQLQISEFNKYLSVGENLEKLLRVFPIIATTNISAHRLGEPRQYFDLVIMDEASQCDSATSLVPILRGKNMVLVGDPQQLNPVIVLDPKVNQELKLRYNIPEAYDYVNYSIYKTYLANDAISDEILLSYHYRCNKDIIGFNNKKYYNNKLNIKSNSKESDPLIFFNVKSFTSKEKNISEAEVEAVIDIVKENCNKSIGIITPFVNQKIRINEALRQKGFNDVVCGTVHAFQGDEKDIILFSLAITNNTRQATYDWLKNNKELINVATSRPRDKLIVFGDSSSIKKLRGTDQNDDLYELCKYVSTKGKTEVVSKVPMSRALGIKPYSTETEDVFMNNLTHALNIVVSNQNATVKKEVPISAIFDVSQIINDLFFTGKFDFVVFDKRGGKEYPILAIELDGPEHKDNSITKERDKKKEEICSARGFKLIRIENSYARRYNHVKQILINYFK